MKRVLLVDSDETALDQMKRMLIAERIQWDLSLAGGGEQALDMMVDGGAFDVLVADLALQDMDGVEFLNVVKERSEETIRICLTSDAGGEALLKASTVAHQFLSKPCDPHDLNVLVLRASALRDHLRDSGLRKRLQDIGGLPSLPALYQEVMNEMRSPDPSVARVAEIIEKDVSMSAKVLQVVNSAGVGLAHRASSITHAASLLGLEKLKTMVLVAEAYSFAETVRMPRGLSPETLWSHSLLVGEYARKIAQEEAEETRIIEDSFMAGLLHDIGLVILATSLPKELTAAAKTAREKGLSLFDAEKETLGATHSEVGGYLLELWGLPDPVVMAITFLDYPTGVPEESYPSGLPQHGFTPLTAVHVANYFCEDEDALDTQYAKCDLDTAHLEALGFADRLEPWWDACHESA